ncbi:molybdenum cofactor cytidylyltransferase [Thermogemmatispora carboxidivorans]|uniref:molybdenum cofactor cytidylyltransferase n=1 Tax=Thermogemmatispora carboxidivorans TaxID=1382306 RepID=UPI00138E508A|nr:molybdenum cofactor cytidylyltransferase [Thermogemmatispora carboxidivorans]
MSEEPVCAAILLAAGTSSRMGGGRHKLLLPLAGRPLVRHSVEAILRSQARPLVIVLGHRAEEVRAALSDYAAHPAIELVVNPAYAQGMSTSLRCGLQALQARTARLGEPAPAGALIFLGDQPFISAALIDRLIVSWRSSGRRLTAPSYGGRRGNPVLFPSDLFSELEQVAGDEGGRRVLERHRAELVLVEIEEALAFHDVDTWEAYQAALDAQSGEGEESTPQH